MEIDGARMRYLRAGSGPALILLHGLLAYSFSWRFAIPALAPYATVYAPDLLGAGFSDRPRGLDHSMRATAKRVLRFIENLELPWFDLLGTSRGGAVAMAAAAECMTPGSCRAQLRRLVLSVPSQSILSPWKVACAFLRHAFRRIVVSFGDRTHAFSVSLLSPPTLRQPQDDSAGKP